MNPNNHSFGFKELVIGQSYEFEVNFTDDLINKFAELSGDCSAIHVNNSAAMRAGYPGRVVHGALVLSFFSRLIGVHLPGDSALVVSGDNRFHKPVIAGDSLLIKGVVSNKYASVNCVDIALSASDVSGSPAVSGLWIVKVAS